MLASISVTAFAADDTVTTDGGGKEISVNAKYVDGVITPEVISADIEWGAMEFTYSVGGNKVWNAQTHQYTVTDATSGRSENGNTVKVTNHSNVNVSATLGFTADVVDVVGTFTEASGTENDSVLELATAVGTTHENAPTATANFGISGAAIDADKTLGTITVTIAKNVIDTFAELQAAVNAGGTVKLGGDITLEDNLNIETASSLILDLNGHTIMGTDKSVYLISGTCTIRGGSINVTGTHAVHNFGDTLTIDQCTISSASDCALYNDNVDVTTVKNSTLSGTDDWYVVFVESGTVSRYAAM